MQIPLRSFPFPALSSRWHLCGSALRLHVRRWHLCGSAPRLHVRRWHLCGSALRLHFRRKPPRRPRRSSASMENRRKRGRPREWGRPSITRCSCGPKTTPQCRAVEQVEARVVRACQGFLASAVPKLVDALATKFQDVLTAQARAQQDARAQMQAATWQLSSVRPVVNINSSPRGGLDALKQIRGGGRSWTLRRTTQQPRASEVPPPMEVCRGLSERFCDLAGSSNGGVPVFAIQQLSPNLRS